MIPVDQFPSTSGAWISVLMTQYEPSLGNLNAWYIMIVAAGTQRIRKLVRIGADETQAWIKWEDWRSKFAAKVDYIQETDAPLGLSEIKYSPPFFIEEDLEVLKLKPKHGNIFIREITPVDEVSMRLEQAGLIPMLAEENKPRPTMGIIISMGPAPILWEELAPGDIVMFSKHAGNTFSEAGEQYRYIQLHEVIGSRTPSDGLDDLIPPNVDPKLIEWAEKMKPMIDMILSRKPFYGPSGPEILAEDTCPSNGDLTNP